MRINRVAVRLFVAVFAVLVVVGCAPKAGQIPTAALPAGKAWAEGKEIFFVHTEASDADVAGKLTNMMKSPVLFVPALAKMPAEGLAQVYVFTNGIAGKGPFGFQAEERTYWQARDVYTGLSPFTYADRINEPILLIHGEADDNMGTFPIQSERLYAALKGKDAAVDALRDYAWSTRTEWPAGVREILEGAN